MKLCFISDTHTYHSDIKIPECNFLIHCGDNTIYGEIWEMKNFLEWFGAQKVPHKIFINGNHEVQVWKKNLTQSMVDEYNKANPSANIHYLEESGLVDERSGLKFWGSPYTLEFFDWAYMYNRYNEDSEKHWAKIPADTDILITHGPPMGVMDGVRPTGVYTSEYAGCPELLRKVREIKPKIHAFGHIHEHYGQEKIEDTLFINAATCNGRYIPVNAPIVVDMESLK